MLPTGNIRETRGLCEICVTELCTVVQSTAIAMDARPVSVNQFSNLCMKWRTPKAGVTGSNPVGRAIFFRSVPGTWVTGDSDHIVNTLELNVFGIGSCQMSAALTPEYS